MTKRGRPPKQRTAIDAISPTAFKRMMDQAALEAKDPRLGTEIGRLCAAGRMTATEATAAFRVAEIYGRYERVAGLKRSSKSPSYEVGYGGGGDTVEGEHDQKAVKAWKELQGHIPVWPAGMRTNLETLAVENRCIGPIEVKETCLLLQILAHAFGITSARDNSAPIRRSPRALAVKQSTGATKLPFSNFDREALHATLLRVNPKLLEDELLEHWTFFSTWKFRERFRREKAGSSG